MRFGVSVTCRRQNARCAGAGKAVGMSFDVVQRREVCAGKRV